MLSDIEIAQRAKMKKITEIAKSIGLSADDIELYGDYKAKIKFEAIEKLKDRSEGQLILVSAITPTPAGEGKTTVSIGLAQAMNKLGKKTIAAIREPSLGPIFGIKGGAAGGGYSQVLPMEDINLHFTGDMHAVTSANNNLAALIDNSIYNGNPYHINPRTVTWKRVMDVNDRSLRNIVIGLGGKTQGVPREDGFDITPASEIMAILCLSNNLEELKTNIGEFIVSQTYDNELIKVKDMKLEGAITSLLKDALKPNLVQTIENTPAFVHGGPFANIAQGTSSIIATKAALKLADYVVTESGFGADIGMEKFFDIKCRYSGLIPNVVVLVATVRALKMHGGGPKVVAGKPLDPAYTEENLDMLRAGLGNMQKHIQNALGFGIPVVVAVNSFADDTPAEVELVREAALTAGAEDSVVSRHWMEGGEGAVALAEAVVKAVEKPSDFKFLYPLDLSIKEKIEIICKEIYGADGVDYEPEAEAKVELYTRLGFDDLPLCMAKTHLSLSHDPVLKGVPSGFRVPISDIRASVGAGFLYPLVGKMSTMPGLPTRPVFYDVDLDLETGRVVGLF